MITDKIDTYCKNAGISVSRFEKICGIGNGIVGKWRNRGSSPSISTLVKIEKATGVPIFMWIEEVRI